MRQQCTNGTCSRTYLPLIYFYTLTFFDRVPQQNFLQSMKETFQAAMSRLLRSAIVIYHRNRGSLCRIVLNPDWYPLAFLVPTTETRMRFGTSCIFSGGTILTAARPGWKNVHPSNGAYSGMLIRRDLGFFSKLLYRQACTAYGPLGN